MSIDVHAHCVPRPALELLRGEGSELGIDIDDGGRVSIAGHIVPVPLRGELVDRSARLAAMDRAGVEVQVLSSWIDLTAYRLDSERGRRWSRLLNEALAEEAASVPERFRSMATVPLQDPDGAADELEYAVRDLGMSGVEIGTNVAGTDLLSAGLRPFWKKAAELGTLVLLHPLEPLSGIDLRSHFLHNIVGRPAESTIAISRLLLGGVLDRHPELRICVVHGGGFLPYQIGRMQRGWEAKSELVATDLTTAPLDALRSLFFDTVLHEPRALRYLIDLVGADRVLLGTDYPFEMGDENPHETISGIPGLTEAERFAIVEGNARRLLGLI